MSNLHGRFKRKLSLHTVDCRSESISFVYNFIAIKYHAEDNIGNKDIIAKCNNNNNIYVKIV